MNGVNSYWMIEPCALASINRARKAMYVGCLGTCVIAMLSHADAASSPSWALGVALLLFWLLVIAVALVAQLTQSEQRASASVMPLSHFSPSPTDRVGPHAALKQQPDSSSPEAVVALSPVVEL